MKAMVLRKLHDLEMSKNPLELLILPKPKPNPGEVLLKILTCGVCHTELDEIEGRTPPPTFPIIPGHQIVGIVEENGEGASLHKIGARVGVGWIFSTCGKCEFCRNGLENLCPDFQATGRDANGGYAEYTTIPEGSAIPIPDTITDAEAAPLLCAGSIGFRSLQLTGLKNGQSLGLMGFGASAHLVLKMVRHQYPASKVYVFARSPKEREFALEIGATWCGNIHEAPPEQLNSIIDTTPAWKPIKESMLFLKPGGRLVINAIRKENRDKHLFSRLDYESHLWLEKEIKSVANVTKQDIRDFLNLAASIPILPEYQEYNLEEANLALLELKNRKIKGAKVLRISTP
ncbi:zinc-dependent alcohol dehydrogenase family protein [bacterium]|nr:zinc-dependent alcohol dehydrogenase family protein [bacterium]